MKATELFFIVAAAAACCAAATLPVDKRHTFGPPFWSESGSLNMQEWRWAGATVVANTHIRLTPSTAGKRGSLWSAAPVVTPGWEGILEFSVRGDGRGGEGMAMWLVPELPASHEMIGTLFGYKMTFHGLGIFLDTRDDDGQGSNPSISAMVSDGTQLYDKARDGWTSQLGGCVADYRNHPHPVALRVRFAPPHGVNHASLQVAVRLDPDSDFEPCFSIPKLPLRSGKYFLGFSAANQVNDGDSHDIFRLAVRAYDPTAQADLRGRDSHLPSDAEEAVHAPVRPERELRRQDAFDALAAGKAVFAEGLALLPGEKREPDPPSASVTDTNGEKAVEEAAELPAGGPAKAAAESAIAQHLTHMSSTVESLVEHVLSHQSHMRTHTQTLAAEYADARQQHAKFSSQLNSTMQDLQGAVRQQADVLQRMAKDLEGTLHIAASLAATKGTGGSAGAPVLEVLEAHLRPPLVAASEHAERAASASQSAKSSLLQLHSSVERLADAVSLLLAQQKQTDASLHQLVEDHRVQKAALEALQREKPQHHAPPTLPAADDGADADTSLQLATIAEQLSVLREEVRAHSASGFWTYFLFFQALCVAFLVYWKRQRRDPYKLF